MPEADAAEMEVFLTKMYQLLPILGVGALVEPDEGTGPSRPMLYCRIKNVVAMGRRTAEGFIVYKGFQAVPEHRPSAKVAKTRREALVKARVLEQEGEHYVFARDAEFGIPSTAGSVIRGELLTG